jgi:ABC-type multidrug transport system permease subunit
MDRMLVAPLWRGALNTGTVIYAVLMILIQTVLIVLLALALGADYAGGVGGVLLLILLAALLGAAFASRSNGVAVLARQRETLIGAVSLVLLPLTFLSTALMQQSLVPGWIRTVAKFNPVNWAVEAGRSALCKRQTGAWSPAASACSSPSHSHARCSPQARSRNTSARSNDRPDDQVQPGRQRCAPLIPLQIVLSH